MRLVWAFTPLFSMAFVCLRRRPLDWRRTFNFFALVEYPLLMLLSTPLFLYSEFSKGLPWHLSIDEVVLGIGLIATLLVTTFPRLRPTDSRKLAAIFCLGAIYFLFLFQTSIHVFLPIFKYLLLPMLSESGKNFELSGFMGIIAINLILFSIPYFLAFFPPLGLLLEGYLVLEDLLPYIRKNFTNIRIAAFVLLSLFLFIGLNKIQAAQSRDIFSALEMHLERTLEKLD